ncbi:superoxide dismutase, Fe-Mn family [Mariniphaga anaerophila]|uniref:Superoxide dismutase n=1 Tax=Mariniphaga anaerophila TaxID=1484053 RepID=A0A1M5G0Z2_9BACT|nr:superoxide dismutase [Mariniphaga anaerophila]SHF97393.1 superoxide dismutase, Fe-Mn family [Mariniphaga anaerophila]
MERRKFIAAIGAVAVASPFIGSFTSCASETKSFEGHKFPELGYDFNALEPYIDAQTMELHYTKHHQGYFNKFMKAAEGTELLNTPMEDIFAKISQQPGAVRNNGGGFYNHSLFWENMTPSKTEISAELKQAIENDFGSVEAFQEEFGKAAKTRFGSGWAWLAAGTDGKLFVTSTPNQDNPLMDVAEKKGSPLLALDVWEHAYYLNYQNRRADYVDNFWNIVNWDVVKKRFDLAKA